MNLKNYKRYFTMLTRNDKNKFSIFEKNICNLNI